MQLKRFRDKLQRVSSIRPASPSVSQQILINSWRVRYKVEDTPPNILDVGFREYSQNEEDGILLFIFSMIGMKHKNFVEICAGNGIECNSTNLTIHHGWTGLLVDGSPDNALRGKTFFKSLPQTSVWPPVFKSVWVTAENVNNIISDNEISGEIDLLSIDVDGVDYWLWKAINVINPRVVVIEINNRLGATDRYTVPYSPDFKTEVTDVGSEYGGASIQALISLGKEKGYRFIGTNRICTNGFFLRDDIKHPWLPEADPESFFNHPRTLYHLKHIQKRVLKRKWEKV